MPIPDDVTLKLDHARHHLQTLNAQFGSFDDRDPYDVVTEVHPKPGTQEGWGHIRMKVNRDPLPEWGLTIGDCVHSLRAALDYAALALWKSHAGEPTSAEIENVMFPIYSSQWKYYKNWRRKIGGVQPEARGIIRKLQPYQRRNDPDGHPLAVLNALDVYDKHRFLHTTSAVVEDAEIEILNRVNVLVTEHPTPRIGGFANGDIIASLKLLAVARHPELEVKLKQTYGIAFDKEGPGRGQTVANTLNDIRLFVHDSVLVPLEPYF